MTRPNDEEDTRTRYGREPADILREAGFEEEAERIDEQMRADRARTNTRGEDS